MIQIDGSYGEGGGQVLRTSLALSIITGKPVHIENVRGQRANPGLYPQHLKAVDAAAAISHAHVEGADLRSTDLVFKPGELRTGRYRFEIGTAGSTSLVLQTIFLPLSLAKSASSVVITGGTHVIKAPCYHYLEGHWLPFMQMLGFDADLSMGEAGFYPQGGGRISATIRPANKITSFALDERGELVSIQGLSAVANLDSSIADRQKRQALRRLVNRYPNTKLKTSSLPSRFKGTLLMLTAAFQPPGADVYTACCYCGLGELHKPAERVADEAVEALEAFLVSDGVIDQFLADQILLPLIFAADESRFRTSCVTQHLLTNAWVISAFTDALIRIDGDTGSPGWVEIKPASSPSNLLGKS